MNKPHGQGATAQGNSRRSATCREPATARKWLAAVARVCDERILLGARKRRSSWCGHGDGQGPASLTFAGAADWLAGWCGVWVCRPGGGRSWGPVARRGGAVPWSACTRKSFSVIH